MAGLAISHWPLGESMAMPVAASWKETAKVASLWRSFSADWWRAVMSVRMETYFSIWPCSPTKGAIMLSTQ